MIFTINIFAKSTGLTDISTYALFTAALETNVGVDNPVSSLLMNLNLQY